MTGPKYPLQASENEDVYEFDSVGPKGVIRKIIYFSRIDEDDLYNLAFGDKVFEPDENGELVASIDDETESRNGDVEKVIATVMESIYDYTKKHPARTIFFKGSDDKRTRAYRITITRHYPVLSQDFSIFGMLKIAGKYVTVPVDSNSSFIGFFVSRVNDTDMKQGNIKEAEASYKHQSANITVNKDLNNMRIRPSAKMEESKRIIAEMKKQQRL